MRVRVLVVHILHHAFLVLGVFLVALFLVSGLVALDWNSYVLRNIGDAALDGVAFT